MSNIVDISGIFYLDFYSEYVKTYGMLYNRSIGFFSISNRSHLCESDVKHMNPKCFLIKNIVFSKKLHYHCSDNCSEVFLKFENCVFEKGFKYKKEYKINFDTCIYN